MVGGEQGVRAAVVALPRGAEEGLEKPFPVPRWMLQSLDVGI